MQKQLRQELDSPTPLSKQNSFIGVEQKPTVIKMLEEISANSHKNLVDTSRAKAVVKLMGPDQQLIVE